MEKCRHGLDIERHCSECLGEAMRTLPAIAPQPQNQHLVELAQGVVKRRPQRKPKPEQPQ